MLESCSNKKRATLTLMITHQCNLNCVYCYEKSKTNGKVMSLSSAKKLVTTYFDRLKGSFDELEIDFMGGEPLMEFPLIRGIAEWIWSKEWPMPYILFATTNGTLVSGEVKDWFQEHKKQFVLGLSYDGTPKSQDSNRTGSSKKIDMQFFAESWPFQPIKMTISPYTIDSISDGIIYLHSQGFNVQANLAFGEKWEPRHLSVYKEQLLKLADYYLTHPEIKRASLLDLNLSVILDEKYSTKYCGAGTGLFFVDTDEKEYPCHVISPLTLSELQLKKIQNVDFTKDELFISDYCKQCLFFNLCPNCCGMNYLQYGGFNKKSRFLCDATKIQVIVNAKLQLQLLIQKKDYTARDGADARAIKKIIHTKYV